LVNNAFLLKPVNDSVIYMFADSGYIFKTHNGGNSWVQIIHNDTIYPDFTSEQRAYAVNTVGQTVYYNVSNNGGLSWIAKPLPAGIGYYASVKMFNDSVGYLLTTFQTSWKYYVIWKTTNNGGEIGIYPVSLTNNLVISPNPGKGIFSIRIPDDLLSDKNITLTVFDALGRHVFEKLSEVENGTIALHLEDASRAIYFVTLTNGKRSYHGKIVRE